MLAQRERNYIFLLDCTKSMKGYGGSPVVWKSTKDCLKKELEKPTEGTTLHVIPFQETVLPSIDFLAEEFDDKKWKEIEGKIDQYVENVTKTNICDAWDAGNKLIDPRKDNYLILLTDGLDNKYGVEALRRKLDQWCNESSNTHAFYVQLTRAAIDSQLVEIINRCPNEHVVDATQGITEFGGLDEIAIYANTRNLDKINYLGFSDLGQFRTHAECGDPYFSVGVVNGTISGGQVPIKIAAKQPIAQINATLPEEYQFTFLIKSDNVLITNPEVKVYMTNKPERSLQMPSQEIDMGKAVWYDRFLFWGAREPDTLSIDLKAVFNDEAKRDGSLAEFLITDSDGHNDFRLLYNGRPVSNGRFVISSREAEGSVLSIVFDTDAKEGKRHLTLQETGRNSLDNINDRHDLYTTTLRARYSVGWNPLKTILMWLGIAILAALLLWFILLKRLFYPPIKVKSIQVSSPYFSKVNAKGKRRVVFTDKAQRQGLLSRIFTGEILYRKNAIWTSPLAFEAGSKKRSLRVSQSKSYVFEPYSSTLKAPNEYKVTNTTTGEKIDITIN